MWEKEQTGLQVTKSDQYVTVCTVRFIHQKLSLHATKLDLQHRCTMNAMPSAVVVSSDLTIVHCYRLVETTLFLPCRRFFFPKNPQAEIRKPMQVNNYHHRRSPRSGNTILLLRDSKVIEDNVIPLHMLDPLLLLAFKLLQLLLRDLFRLVILVLGLRL